MSRKHRIVHPLAPLLNGCRLYYILLRFSKYKSIDHNLFGTVLQNLGIKESTCAYLIFGDRDLLLRLWIPETRIDELVKELHRELNVLPDKTQVLLVEEMNTWYERRLEAGWKDFDCLSLVDMKRDILEGKVPKELMFDEAAMDERDQSMKSAGQQDDEKIRFFLMLETPYTTKPELYRWLVTEGAKKLWERETVVREVSVYSFSTALCQGVIIKGTMLSSQVHLAGRSVIMNILSMIRNYAVSATTYITAHEFASNSNYMPKLDHSSARHRYSAILHSLLQSEPLQRQLRVASLPHAGDFDNETLAERETALSRQKAFVEECVVFFDHFWLFDEKWEERLTEVKLLFRWVLQGQSKDEQLSAVILRGLAITESRIRSLLERASFVVKDYKDKEASFRRALKSKLKLNESQVEDVLKIVKGTLPLIKEQTFEPMIGLLENLINVLISTTGLKRMADLLQSYVLVLKSCVKTRNFLAHGEAGSLFALDPNDREGWQTHVIRYVNHLLLSDHAFLAIDRLVAAARALPSKADAEGVG